MRLQSVATVDLSTLNFLSNQPLSGQPSEGFTATEYQINFS